MQRRDSEYLQKMKTFVGIKRRENQVIYMLWKSGRFMDEMKSVSVREDDARDAVMR